jgi:superfamily II DNA helicase RecQ
MWGELDATVVDLVAARWARYGAKAKILIYCSSVAEMKRIGKLLQCLAYYYEIATDEEKAYMVQAFTAGVEKLCTATTILTLGIHAPGVQVVIYITMCDLLMNLVQESGRAGRQRRGSE